MPLCRGVIALLLVRRVNVWSPIYEWALASAHPEIGLCCGKIKMAIFAPLDVVVCNKQTPVSSSAKLTIFISPRDEPFMDGH
ncbi:MAG: hypothetical protein ACJATV_000093 [Granulosicoccus sp.]|jgi:hypothetical protein